MWPFLRILVFMVDFVRLLLQRFLTMNEHFEVQFLHYDADFVSPLSYRTDQPAAASLMYKHRTKNVDEFCSDDENPRFRHNEEAPNRMNRVCGGRSSWQVIEESSDFRDGINPSLPRYAIQKVIW